MKFTHVFALFLFIFTGFPLYSQFVLQIEEESEEGVAVDKPVLDSPESKGHGRASGPVVDQLDFLDGDRLSGDLIGVEGPLLTWRHADASAPIVLKTDNLQNVTLRGIPNPGNLLKLAQVEMTNGDVFRGNPVSMDATTLIIKTPFAGDIPLNVLMVKAIFPASESKIIYEGPNHMDEWKGGNKKTWEIKNSVLYSKSGGNSIGQDIPNFPDLASVEFDLAWRGQPQFNIAFWGANPEQFNNNSYTLMIQGNYIRLYRYSNTHGGTDLGAFNYEKLQGKGRVRVGLMLDRKTAAIGLLLDGELVKQWKDSGIGPITGKALMFQSNSGVPLKISNLRVSQWDGKFSNNSSESTMNADLAEFSNGDKFSGKLESISEGKMKFTTDFASFEVPVVRVARVELAATTRELPRRNPGDVEVYFPTGERITLKLSSLGNEVLTGESQNCGGLRILRGQITQVKFNIYDPRRNVSEDTW